MSVILLAAGLSRRFGADDKLLAHVDGHPLVQHAASALNQVPFAQRVAVVRPSARELSQLLKKGGFRLVYNPDASNGISRSIRLGVAASSGADALIIALADMPLVPPEHFINLCEHLSPAAPIVASRGEHGPTAPAGFLSSEFAKLMTLEGDFGARELIAPAPTIPIAAHLLADIDYAAQLARASIT